jgi:hypothetical protein
MADHRATWVRLRKVAWQRFPDDDLAAEIAARELFYTEETGAYAADLDAQMEEHGILDTARLRGVLCEVRRAKGSGAGGNEEEYVHLDDDDLDYLKPPTDEEVAESTEQMALMASFETQRRDESTYRLMAAERRAAVDELAASQQRARHSAHHRIMAAARASTSTPSYYADAGIIEDVQRRRHQWCVERLRRCLETVTMAALLR